MARKTYIPDDPSTLFDFKLSDEHRLRDPAGRRMVVWYYLPWGTPRQQSPLFPRKQRSPGSARSRPGRETAQRTLDGEDRSGIIQGRGERGFLPTGATAIS